MDQTEAIRRHFDAQAGSYDDYTGNGAWTPNQYLAGVLHALAASNVEVRTALDLGTGTGQTLEVVRAAFPRAQLWASDVSAAMLDRAALRVPDAHFEVADISSHVAGLTRSFDLVTAVGCLEMVADLMTVLPQLMRHLNPGGHLALTVQALIDGQGAEQARIAVPSRRRRPTLLLHLVHRPPAPSTARRPAALQPPLHRLPPRRRTRALRVAVDRQG